MKSSSKCALAVLLVACALSLLVAGGVRAEREDRDQDDFDDSGFDDSGYNSPQNVEAEGSHNSPSNYSPSSEEDLDDDDEVDESNNVPKVAGAQQFYSPANSIVMPIPMYERRQKRSVVQERADEQERDIEDAVAAESQQPLIRKRRYSKSYIGPVYTYVKTDKHAHYKWGVKHKVGKHLG